MTTHKSERLVSLDVFRGITIAGMILVNNPGDWNNIYPALEHAKWNGCTPTDLIFPFFLFIVGVAITLSLTKRKERGDNLGKISLNILRRSVILFVLGLLLNGFPYYNLSTIRIPGVLQRIAVVYLFSALIFLFTNWKVQALIGAALLFLYWGLMTLIPVPGVGYPNLNPATNLAAYIDNLLLHGHLWQASKVWDPEGILSTLPAISTCLSGVMLGHWLKSNIENPDDRRKDALTKVIWMFVIGNIGLVIGIIWDIWFPMNKSIWTSSYVVYTSSMALLFFAICYWFSDILNIRWWTKPFIVYGLNAITVFFLSGIVGRLLTLIKVTGNEGQPIALKTFLYETFFVPYFSPINASLAWAIVYILIWLGLMWILYAKKIFIKI